MVVMMRNKIFLFSIFSLVFVSCQKDSILVAEGDKSIVCQVSVKDVNDTKSLEVSKDSLKKYGFRMDAWLEADGRSARRDLWPHLDEDPHYIKDAMITYTGDQWKSSVDTVKWTNQIWTNFWAQYPYTITGRGNLTWPAAPKVITDAQEKTPSFNYDMSAYAGEEYAGKASEVTPDLLVAYSRVKYDVDANTFQPSGGVYFKFAHVLSAINFSQPRTSTEFNIDSIMITGICTNGICRLDGSSDSEPSTGTVVVSWTGTDTLSYNSSFSQFLGDRMGSYDPNKYIFLIPQTLTSTAKMIAYVRAVGAGSAEKERRYEVNIGGFTWKSGSYYTYKIDFDPEKHFLTVTVNEDYYKESGIWD